MTKVQKKNREFLAKIINREHFYANKQKDRAGWAFLVLTLIVAGYFFVWAWTNF